MAPADLPAAPAKTREGTLPDPARLLPLWRFSDLAEYEGHLGALKHPNPRAPPQTNQSRISGGGPRHQYFSEAAQGDSNVRANLSTDGFKHIRSPAASPPPTSPLPPWSEPPPRPAWPTAQLSPSCFSRLHLSPPIASQAVRFSKPGHITPLGWLLTELTRETKVLTRPQALPGLASAALPASSSPSHPHPPRSGQPGVSPVSQTCQPRSSLWASAPVLCLQAAALSTASCHLGLRGPSQITFLQTVWLHSRKVTH